MGFCLPDKRNRAARAWPAGG